MTNTIENDEVQHLIDMLRSRGSQDHISRQAANALALLVQKNIQHIENYKPVAVRQNHLGNCVISYLPSEKNFIVSVNGTLSGPFKLRELEALRDNFNDILDMKGQYLFISAYDIYGEEI